MQPDLFCPVTLTFLRSSMYEHLLKVTNTTLLKRIQSQDVHIQKKYALHLLLNIPQFLKSTSCSLFLIIYRYLQTFIYSSAEVNKAVTELNVLTSQHVNLVACCIKPPVCLVNYTLMA
jgi:hypothetical protein